MAARRVPLPSGAVFHSDRGSQYTSHDFAVALKRHGIRQSVGRTGICFDNARVSTTDAVCIPGSDTGRRPKSSKNGLRIARQPDIVHLVRVRIFRCTSLVQSLSVQTESFSFPLFQPLRSSGRRGRWTAKLPGCWNSRVRADGVPNIRAPSEHQTISSPPPSGRRDLPEGGDPQKALLACQFRTSIDECCMSVPSMVRRPASGRT